MRDQHAWRLSLSSLFVWMAALGAGFAAASASRGPWSDVLSRGLVAAATVLVAIGLTVEAADLRSAHRAASFPSRDARFGHWLAVVWRAVLAVVLVALLMAEYLVNRGLIDLEPPPGSDSRFYSSTLLWTSHYFGLLMAIWPHRARAKLSERTAAGRVLDHAAAAVAWVMLAAAFACKMIGMLFVTFLVDVAVNGVQMAQPLAYVDRAIGDERARLLNRFLLSSLAACACVTVALLAARAAARPSRGGLPWRIAACVAMVAGLTTAALCLTRAVHVLGPRLAPEMYRVGFQPWPPMWVTAAFLASLLIASGAVKLAARPLTNHAPRASSAMALPSEPSDSPRLHPNSWWHRRRATLVLLLVSSVMALGRSFFWAQLSLWDVLSNASFLPLVEWGQWFRELLLSILENVGVLTYFDLGAPPAFWIALVGWACLRGLFSRTSNKDLPAVVPVSPGAFAFAWLALAAIVAVAVPTIFFTTWSLLWSPLFWGRWWP